VERPELARRVDLSDSRFRHLFGAQVGVSVTHFRLERRLGVGARLLGTTFEDVRQIAQALGFTAQGFRRALLARYGVTPTEYRSRFWRGWRSLNQHEQ
jgi:AraC family transcriptional regulator of arabinose operon